MSLGPVAEDSERFIRAQDTRDEQHSHRARSPESGNAHSRRKAVKTAPPARSDDEMKSVHAHGSVADCRALFSPSENVANHNREIGPTASGGAPSYSERWLMLKTLAHRGAAVF